MSSDHLSLVEPEGTNAGSAASTTESRGAGSGGPGSGGAAPGGAGGDVLSGGAPDRSPDLGDPAVEAAEETDMAGAPAERDAEPGHEHGSSGQDAGSMDAPA